MLWMTVYLWTSGDRAKTIEAEWCANALWWVLSNYVYYTLTSRNLRENPNSEPISPSYYYIQLTWSIENNCTEQQALTWNLCRSIILWYATWYDNPDLNIQEYQEVTVNNTCRHGKPHLWFYRSGWAYSWNIDHIRMNKWFTPRDVNAERVFFLHDRGWVGQGGDKEKLLLWDIIVVLCEDETCSCSDKWCARKQIGKRKVDARSQTIAFKKCRYYKEWNEGNICKTREDCIVYSSSDPTSCERY